MIVMRTEVEVKGISGEHVSEFMLNCTDTEYREWWPEAHVAFHTIKRFPENLGNLVLFDEYVGRRRLKFKGVVTESVPGEKVVWQMMKIVSLPAWLVLEFEDHDDKTIIMHTMKAGFEGIGRLLDPILRLYLTKGFEDDLAKHARIEFKKLADILS